jgi:hypothetical protein
MTTMFTSSRVTIEESNTELTTDKQQLTTGFLFRVSHMMHCNILAFVRNKDRQLGRVFIA